MKKKRKATALAKTEWAPTEAKLCKECTKRLFEEPGFKAFCAKCEKVLIGLRPLKSLPPQAQEAGDEAEEDWEILSARWRLGRLVSLLNERGIFLKPPDMMHSATTGLSRR
jgi:hypothetical protein